MLCRKCHLVGTLVIRKEYCYCIKCFLLYIDHKFRACIGKNTKLPWNDNVLVCLSGGRSSTALLDLVYSGISINSHKKLKINPYILYITGLEKTKDNEILNIVKEQCNRYNFHVYVVHISEYYSTNNIPINLNWPLTDPNNLAMLECTLKNVSATTKYDFITQIRNTLITRIAKQLQCRFIFTGESTTKLAVKLLSNIAIGRGSQISNDIGFADNRDKDVEILRPMKDITVEEIEHYIKIKNLTILTENCKENSLHSVVENFVLDLQDNFSATLTTVCKTAEKISSKPLSDGQKICVLCQSNFDNDPEKFTAVNATNISRLVSTTVFDDINDLFIKNLQNEESLDEPCLNKKGLCYSCKRNLTEINNNQLHTHIQTLI